MKNQITYALSAAITTLLRPLVRLLLRNGVPYGLFADLAKRVYIEIASKDFGIPDRKASKSRISIITGLTRKEVLRIMRLPVPEDLGLAERYNRAARVVSGWVRDRQFAYENGTPSALPFDGDGPTFSELVRTYSGDATPRAVLDELVRVGAAERLEDGWIRLIGRSYIPRNADVDKIGILGTDVADLIATIDYNIRFADVPLYQRKVCYDNLPAEALPLLRKEANNRAQTLLEELDRLFSENDRDVTHGISGTGRKRAGVGIFFFEEDVLLETKGEEPGPFKGDAI